MVWAESQSSKFSKISQSNLINAQYRNPVTYEYVLLTTLVVQVKQLVHVCVCVCLSVCPIKNFWAKWAMT